jgi:MoaA/NifB/PqqE/SkfB family radical SAM enzyme
MDCHSQVDIQKEFSQRFRNAAIRDRIPLSGSIDITTRCNFSCVHCYLPPKSRQTQGTEEQDTATVKNQLDQITEAGCLNLLITGGEPLFRKDFSEIYTHARENGLIVTVFTNGSLVKDEHIRLFTELPPAMIEITVYGATPKTYEAITGIKNAHKMVIDGINRLHTAKIRISAKTILMDLNVSEFKSIESMADRMGIPFRFDAAIVPRVDGDPSPLERRVQPETAVELEFQDHTRLNKWKDFLATQSRPQPSEKLFRCGAGSRSFHITAGGRLQPCMMAPEPSCGLKEQRFMEGWSNIISTIGDLTITRGHRCGACDLMTLCGYCPAITGLEDGCAASCLSFLCRMGQLRNKILTG